MFRFLQVAGMEIISFADPVCLTVKLFADCQTVFRWRGQRSQNCVSPLPCCKELFIPEKRHLNQVCNYFSEVTLDIESYMCLCSLLHNVCIKPCVHLCKLLHNVWGWTNPVLWYPLGQNLAILKKKKTYEDVWVCGTLMLVSSKLLLFFKFYFWLFWDKSPFVASAGLGITILQCLLIFPLLAHFHKCEWGIKSVFCCRRTARINFLWVLL